MAIITKPFTHNPDNNNVTPAESAKVNANDDAIYGEFNGNISDPNISALANIQQSKILNLTADLNTIRGQKVQEVVVQAYVLSTTYIKPADLLFARVIVVGGGGSGGKSAAASLKVSSGGGGGGYAESWLMSSAIAASESVVIGGGGASQTVDDTIGNNGGTSAFGALVQASAGQFGNVVAGGSFVAGGLGGQGTAGQLLLAGNPGGDGFSDEVHFRIGGHGGISGAGLGAGGGSTSLGGTVPGGGGSGSIGGNSGAGAPGIVIVVEYKA